MSTDRHQGRAPRRRVGGSAACRAKSSAALSTNARVAIRNLDFFYATTAP
jgi:hypothetical protein